MKRLKPDQKEKILLAVRDAVFQQVADKQEDMWDEAAYEAERELEKQGFEMPNEAVGKAIQNELRAIWMRLFDATKKGDDR